MQIINNMFDVVRNSREEGSQRAIWFDHNSATLNSVMGTRSINRLGSCCGQGALISHLRASPRRAAAVRTIGKERPHDNVVNIIEYDY